MDTSAKQILLKTLSFIFMIAVFTTSAASCLVMLFYHNEIVESLLRCVFLEPIDFLFTAWAFFGDFTFDIIALTLIFALLGLTLVSAIMLLFEKKFGYTCSLIILGIDLIYRLIILPYNFSVSWDRGFPSLVGIILKIVFIIFIACYIRNCKEN